MWINHISWPWFGEGLSGLNFKQIIGLSLQNFYQRKAIVVSFVVNALAHASYFMQPKPISKSQQEHKSKPVDSFLEDHCFIGSRILSWIFSIYHYISWRDKHQSCDCGFSLFIIIYHEEISIKAAMGGKPIFLLKSP